MKERNYLKNCFSWAVISLAVILAATQGCSKRYSNLPAYWPLPIADSENESVGRFKTSYLADQIHAYFRGSVSGPIAVSTFVDLDNLYQSSTFGRVLGEQLMSELAMHGYNVIEIRMADALQIMSDSGELALSRDTKTLAANYKLSAIVVGTYVVSPERVYLNARVVDPKSSTIISAGSVEMSRTAEITRLVRSGSFPGSMERIPVRHLGYGLYPAPYYWPYYSFAYPVPNPSLRADNESSEWAAPVKPGIKLPHTENNHIAEVPKASDIH